MSAVSPISTHAALRAARDAVRVVLPDLGPAPDLGTPLEVSLDSTDPPRIAAATVIEDPALTEHSVDGDAGEGFSAFLDGTQKSLVFDYLHGAPLVLGNVAAVIRERRDRRMATWGDGPLTSRRIYASRTLVGDAIWSQWLERGLNPADTSQEDNEAEHPMSSALRARELVQNDREAMETKLAELWCARESRALFIDGGLRGSDVVARCGHAIGVVKSHRTLYAGGADLQVVYSLRAGCRTSVFRVETGRRAPVLSWYLRLRDATGRDPFFGLVRVEVALTERYRDRAEEVSRWILAEITPLALPDTRWHNLVYPVRDCEEFLRAIA